VKERLPDMTQNVVRCWCISKEIDKDATTNTKIQFYRKIKSMIKKNDIRSVPTYHTMMSDAITEVQYGTVEVAIVVEVKKLNVTIQ
jgi:hypothetical protein